MKKKLLALAAVAALAVSVLYIPVQDVKADCPNGCLTDCGDGCECNGWHPNLKEKNWDGIPGAPGTPGAPGNPGN